MGEIHESGLFVVADPVRKQPRVVERPQVVDGRTRRPTQSRVPDRIEVQAARPLGAPTIPSKGVTSPLSFATLFRSVVEFLAWSIQVPRRNCVKPAAPESELKLLWVPPSLVRAARDLGGLGIDQRRERRGVDVCDLLGLQ